jgi:D-alanyl-D-alanine carboxypeptidase/D-alanyl-D-alanine-endopeptidase (penicillin-binding protein 4)
VAVDNPTQYYVAELRRALIAHGIDVNGKAVDASDAPDAQKPTGRALIELSSAPLRELAVRLMKSSQNQYAETLLKTLGVRAGFGTWDAGRNIAEATLVRWGVAQSEIVMADGSGLSRYGYVTAGALSRILAHVYADPALRDPFIASLPIAGRDGTLASRLQGTPADGNVRAKTGSMTRVRALSGYMKTANGEPLAFSIIANNYAVPANTIDRATDAILLALTRFSR